MSGFSGIAGQTSSNFNASSLSGAAATGSLGDVSWLVWGIAGFFLLVLIFVPRYLNRMLNLGPVLGVLAFIGAAVALPYALKVAVTPTNTTTNASIESEPKDIEVKMLESDQVVVRWKTPVPAIGAVRYGLKESSLDLVAFTNDPLDKTLNHEAVISNARSGQTLYIEIISGSARYGENGKPIMFMIP